MRHAALRKLYTLDGGFTRTDGGWRAEIPGTYWPDKMTVEIGLLEILLDMLLLLSYLAIPRVGNLKQELHLFGYLKAHLRK